jgi:hypothetical protein
MDANGCPRCSTPWTSDKSPRRVLSSRSSNLCSCRRCARPRSRRWDRPPLSSSLPWSARKSMPRHPMGRLHPSRYFRRGTRQRPHRASSRSVRRGYPRDCSHSTLLCQYRQSAAAASLTLEWPTTASSAGKGAAPSPPFPNNVVDPRRRCCMCIPNSLLARVDNFLGYACPLPRFPHGRSVERCVPREQRRMLREGERERERKRERKRERDQRYDYLFDGVSQTDERDDVEVRQCKKRHHGGAKE